MIRTIVFLSLTALAIISCNENADRKSEIENQIKTMENQKDSIKQWYLTYIDEVWNKRNFAVANNYWGEDFKNVFAPQFEHGPNEMKNQVVYFLNAFDSFHFEIKDIMIDGDKISVWAEITGRHTGELFGIKPTGKEVKFREAAWYKLKDGKLDEVYPFVDWNTLFEQLGEYPQLAK